MTHQEIEQAFVTKRLEDMTGHTGMWGSNEAVEAQAITLMEVEFLSKAPEILEENPRIVLDEYVKVLVDDMYTHARTSGQEDSTYSVRQNIRCR